MDIKKQGKLNYGLTLIELLIYISITGILMATISSFFYMMYDARVKNQTINEVEQQGIQVMQLVTQTIRNADGIISPAQSASNASLMLDVAGSSYNTAFDLGGNTLRVTENNGAPVNLTSSRIIASSLVFDNLSRNNTPGLIRARFTLSHINPGGKSRYEYSKTFYGSAGLR
jgi:Tfp pilus assembly protein PilW